MKLRDLCNELWDDVVALMDWVTLGKLYGKYTGTSHYDYLKTYLSMDRSFIYKLCSYFNLDMEDQDVRMYLPVGV